MTVEFKYLSLTALLTILLTPCASYAGEKFGFDYSSAKIGDFDGIWEGSVNCAYPGWGKYPHLIWVEIKNGVGRLQFDNKGETPTAKLNLKNGKIKWRGRYKDRKGQRKAFAIKGQWMSDKVKVKGRRGTGSCSGSLKPKT